MKDQPYILQSEKVSFSVKTVKNKLRLLEYFCNYIIETLQTVDANTVTDGVSENLGKLRKCQPFWHKSMRKRCTVEDVLRCFYDTNDRVDPSDIQHYLSSDYASGAVQLRTETGTTFPSMYDFCRARNHMLRA